MAKKKRKRGHRSGSGPDRDQGAYTCPTCGEEIIIPLDATQGSEQIYTEDCPVCCHPNVIHVEFDEAWDAPRVWAEAE